MKEKETFDPVPLMSECVCVVFDSNFGPTLSLWWQGNACKYVTPKAPRQSSMKKQ